MTEPGGPSAGDGHRQPADLLLHGGMLVTMDAQRRVFRDGAIAVRGGAIVDVGPTRDVAPRWDAARALDLAGLVATPGLVNAHVHLTGLDLLPGLEPVDSPMADHLAKWALPVHAHSTPEDERATARYLAMHVLKQGATALIEAGTVRFPAAVLDGLADLGVRAALGTWAWDRWDDPPAFAATTSQAIARLEEALALVPPSDRFKMWPSLVGHTACSDDLFQAAAGLARAASCHWTFHMSPGPGDGEAFRRRTGRDPLVHLEALGVLDERSVVAHAIHVADREVEALGRSGAGVAFCPASSLHLTTGLTRAGRHPEMAHVALGTDSPHRLDLLRAAGLACDLYADMRNARTALPPERALEWLTLGGARALGWADRIGSLEPGKRADVAAFAVTQPVYNVANALLFGPTRAMYVVVDGAVVVADGHVQDEDEIVREAAEAGRQVARRAGLPAHTGWPLLD